MNKKILFVFIFGIFLLSLVSATILDYDDQTRTATFHNNILFIKTGEIATAQLLTPLDYKVGLGYQKVWEMEITGFRDYIDFITQIDLYDTKDNMKQFDRDYDLMKKEIKEIEVDEYICEFDYDTQKSKCIVSGSHFENKTIYTKLQRVDFKKEEIMNIAMFTIVEEGDRVEWIPIMANKRVEQWSIWTADNNVDILSVWKFNEQTGTTAYDELGINNGSITGATINQTGILNESYDFDGTGDYINIGDSSSLSFEYNEVFSISVWVNSSASTGTIFSKNDGTDAGKGYKLYLSTGSFFWLLTNSAGDKMNVVAQGIDIRDGNWHNYVLTKTTSSSASGFTNYVDGTLRGTGVITDTLSATTDNDLSFRIGSLSDDSEGFNGTMDELVIWKGRTLNQTDVTNLWNGGLGISYTDNFNNPPNVTAISPENNTEYTTAPIDINFTCYGSDDINFTSMEFYLDGSLTQTNSSGINNTNYVFTETLNDGNYNWSCIGNDNESEQTQSEIRFLTIDTTPFIEFLTPPTLVNYANITQEYIPIKINTTTIQLENISYDLYNINGTILNQFYTTEVYDINFTDIPDAHYHYNVTICATTGECNSTETRHINHDATAPEINITSPSGVFDFLIENFTLDLNWTVIDINLDSCWFNYNGINTTLTCNDNHTEFNYSANINNLTFYANDTFGNINSEETNWDYVLLETNRTFDNPVYETQTSSFIINYLVPNDTININALLDYNGTQFTSTTICDGINCSSTTIIDIPTIESASENVTFNWEITIFSSSPSVTINFSSETQTINEIQFEECGALTDVTLNFTSFDEEDLTVITNFDFDGNFEFWLGAGTHKKQYNLTKSGVSSVAICLEPTGVEFRIDADIEYDETDTDNYTRRNYYFLNDTVSDDTQDIGLGLLKVGDSTSFIEKVQDRNLLSVPGVLVITERYYPGLDEFKIVQIAQTDEVGESVGFFQTETVEYRFKVKDEFEIVLTTDKQKVVGTVAPFTITLTIGESIDVSWREFEELPDFSSSPITAERDTKIITWTYLDDGDDFEQANLRVWLINDTNDEIEICNDIGNESSQTLTCNLSAYDSGRFNIGSFLTRGGTTYIIEQTIFSLGGMDIDENYGLFLGLLILLICAFAFKYNEIAGIILLNVGAIAVDLIGFIDFGWTTLFAFISASIIIIAVLEK